MRKSLSIVFAFLFGLSALYAQSAYGPFADSRHGHRYVQPRPFLWQGGNTKGITPKMQILVIPANFSDVYFFYSKQNVQDMLSKQGYNLNGAIGCAKEYVEAQLRNTVEFTVAEPVTVSNTRKYYGENDLTGADKHPGEYVAEACIQASTSIDFSKFDNDGDGYVDNVCVLFPGEDEAQQTNGKNSDYIWSHFFRLSSSDYGKVLTLNGVKLDNYTVSAELFKVGSDDRMAPVGTFCHELMHAFGLVDMYDTDYELSGGTAAAVWGKTSIMDSGNYNSNGNIPPNLNAAELERLGICKPIEIKSGDYTLIPLGTEDAQTYKISNPLDSLEYYLFECRLNDGWDKSIGGAGMLMYHIDRGNERSTYSDTYKKDLSSYERWNIYDEVNCRPDHQCCDLIEADQRKDCDVESSAMSDISGIYFPRYGATGIGGESAIRMKFWDGSEPKFAITNILFSNNVITFRALNTESPIPPEPVDPPTAKDMLYIMIIYNADGTMKFKLSNSISSNSVKWYCNGAEISPESFKAEGKCAIRAEVEWEDGSVDYLFRNMNAK